jgi:hypothetical protein
MIEKQKIQRRKNNPIIEIFRSVNNRYGKEYQSFVNDPQCVYIRIFFDRKIFYSHFPNPKKHFTCRYLKYKWIV